MFTNKNTVKQKEPTVVGLMLLSAFAVMGAIILTPSLPSITTFYHISTGYAQMTVTLFLLGYALGQLVYGPIANRYGRKPALYLGIVVATIGSILSILSEPLHSFPALLLGRVLEALGSSAGLVVSYTIVNDFYVKRRRKIMGLLMLAFAIVPGIAVLLGGLIAQYLDWSFCFYFLLFYGLLLVIPVWMLPETLLEKDHRALKVKKMLQGYWAEFKNKWLVGFAICSGFSSGCIYVFGAEGPFIGIHLLGVKPALYGLLGLIPYMGTLIGSLMTIKFSNFNAIKVIIFAYLLEASAAVILFVLFLCHVITLTSMLGSMVLLCMGHPMVAGTSAALGLGVAINKAFGSAVLNFTAMAVAMFSTFLLGMLHVQSALILPAMFILLLIMMAAIFIICKLRAIQEPVGS